MVPLLSTATTWPSHSTFKSTPPFIDCNLVSLKSDPFTATGHKQWKQFWTMFSFSLLLAVQKAFLHVTRSAAKFIYLPPACVPIDSPIKNASDESNNLMRQDEERQARERMNLNSTCNTPSLPFPGKLTLYQPLLFSQSEGWLSWKWGFWSQLVAHYWGSETTTATESNPWAKRRTFAA